MQGKKGWLDGPSDQQECHTEEKGLNPQIAEWEDPDPRPHKLWQGDLYSLGRGL